MNHERIKTEYLCYLMNRAQLRAAGELGYLKLCEKMQATGFLPILEMDANRCGECVNLRSDFAEADERINYILNRELSETGTMLELLIVLAEKIDYDLSDSRFESGNGTWIKEMLLNCGLIEATNNAFRYSGEEAFVEEILDILNRRKYGWDGQGGLFPLRWPKEDQRDLELIIQMNNYIEENYDIS